MLKTIFSFLRRNHLGVIIFVFAILGFIASFTLSVDKLDILRNPNQQLPCNINSYFNCGIVMRSKYAEVAGIPWSFLGVAGYPAVMLLGLIIIERKKMSLWLTWLTTLPAFCAFALSTYFMYVSAYLIGVFCPWCIVSAVSATSIFFALITHNLAENNYNLKPEKADFIARKIKGGWSTPFVILWFILIAIVEYLPFWFDR